MVLWVHLALLPILQVLLGVFGRSGFSTSLEASDLERLYLGGRCVIQLDYRGGVRIYSSLAMIIDLTLIYM